MFNNNHDDMIIGLKSLSVFAQNIICRLNTLWFTPF